MTEYDTANRFDTDAVIDAVAHADGSVHLLDLATDANRQRQGLAPVRKTGAVALTEAASFALYVNDHLEAGATELYGDRKQGRIVAVLNGHRKLDAAAGWADHRATLQLQQTEEWKAWTGASRVLTNQVAFAEFLEDHLADVVEPDAAQLLEVATSIHASTGASFRSVIRLDNGQVQAAFDESIDARAGKSGQLEIPTRIVLGLAPFEGCAKYRIEARLRYRLSSGQLTIGIVLDRPDDVVRAAFGDVVEQVQTATGETVLFGTAR